MMQIMIDIPEKEYQNIMHECICVECDHQCYEYYANGLSDKAYYEWTYKQDKCLQAKSEDIIDHCDEEN